ncbi:hypothetical protein K458DRAFT_481085 [Lentithecium fluviatile CBS 122367]|uniref:Wax synthase domain-containing protein n=1 Tax=Lentithecium fluviatile CBS 122367 TaxID=1168545 RepID=A0A6G1IJ90_9PLEO|nr:hypothetical protein K458DRAFT_481085 [Lentithecium fluviatile CBS 122367]
MLHLASHPVFLWFFSFTIDVLVVSFTSPSSPVRPACLPVLFFNVWLMLRSGKTVHYTHPMYANLLGGSVFTLALQYFNVVILRKSSYEAGGPTTTPEGAPLRLLANRKQENAAKRYEYASVLVKGQRRVVWGISHFFDSRLSGTPWEVKNVPTFSTKNPSHVPSKGDFLRNILRCIVSLILLDLARPSSDTTENAILFADSKVPFFTRLGSVSGEDIAMRFITTTASTAMTYLLFQSMYSSGAVIMVGLNLSPPERWRPLFGDILGAYSLRRAWSTFWHQGMANCLTGPAKFFTFRVLGLPKTSSIARYIFIVVVFPLSGAMHICGELTAGIPLSESGVVQFFTTQALGLLLEDAVVGGWRLVVGRSDCEAQWWKKVFGFVWVVTWLAWSMPVWTYPASRRSQGEGILPFSIVNHLKA